MDATKNIEIEVKVRGKYALFTRPEFKTEQASYDVPTPTAARGIIEAIAWKPQVRYVVTKTKILAPIKKELIMRNMIKSRQSKRSKGIIVEKDRTQRHSLLLKDVEYIFSFYMELTGISQDNRTEARLDKYLEIFQTRLATGACFSQPYLGCREFVAEFSAPTGDEKPIDLTSDLGPMIANVPYDDPTEPVRYFFARIENGVIEYPHAATTDRNTDRN